MSDPKEKPNGGAAEPQEGRPVQDDEEFERPELPGERERNPFRKPSRLAGDEEAFERDEEDEPDDRPEPRREYSEPRPRNRQPKFEYDPMVAESFHRQMSDEALSQTARQMAEPLFRELQSLPDYSRMSREEAEEAYQKDPVRFQQVLARRGAIQSELNLLPQTLEQRRAMNETMISRIVTLQHEFARQNPDEAAEVLSQIERLPANLQSSPATYQMLLEQALGKKYRAERQKKAQKQASRAASLATRGGSPAAPVVDSPRAKAWSKAFGLKGKRAESYIRRVSGE